MECEVEVAETVTIESLTDRPIGLQVYVRVKAQARPTCCRATTTTTLPPLIVRSFSFLFFSSLISFAHKQKQKQQPNRDIKLELS